jgi:hypothetical protein
VKALDSTIAEMATQIARRRDELDRHREARALLLGEIRARSRAGSHPHGGLGATSRAARHVQVALLLAERGPMGSSAIAAEIGYGAPSVATLLRRPPGPDLFRRVPGRPRPKWDLTDAGRELAARPGGVSGGGTE